MIFCTLFLPLLVPQFPFSSAPREMISLDQNWKFHLGNATDPQKDFNYGTGEMYAKTGYPNGPFSVGFPDGSWRTLNLPHDWAIELPFVKSNDENLIGHGSKPLGANFPETSIGWYRRTFSVPTSQEGRNLTIRFDGVFRDAEVFYNGMRLGEHAGGYEPFSYDVGPITHYNSPNELVVRVNASENSGWFYEGAGIYRHVWLICRNPVHIKQYGVDVQATPVGSDANVKIVSEITNNSDQSQQVRVTNSVNSSGNQNLSPSADSGSIEQTLAPGQNAKFTNILSIKNPTKWSIENPYLYRAVTLVNIKQGTTWQTSDVHIDSFGVRTIKFTADHGFFLNGKHVFLKGACDHQDSAGVGVAVPDSINFYRIQQLKKYGFNALRTSHNMPTRSVVEACDKLGFLVMDETRTFSPARDSLTDLGSLVKRDRNSPSVILWSIGNEEVLEPTYEGARIAKAMMNEIHKFDQTRPITMASNHGDAYLGANSVLDVRGWNYYVNGNTINYHKAHPTQPIFGSEEASTLSTRGEYANDPAKGYVTAYDTNNPGWGSTAEDWVNYFNKRPFLAGAFVWTGFDYRGEPTPYGWPCISSQFGVLDTCGFPKDIAYYYKAWWTNAPLVHLAPHWTWPGKEGQDIRVWIESNCDEVELLLNGKEIGRKLVPRLAHIEWQVPYAPGRLEAIGFNNGVQVCDDVEQTAGSVAKLIVTPNVSDAPANNEDAVVFNVKAEDSNGNFVPIAQNKITFSLLGSGCTILGVGNGNPSSHEPDTFISNPEYVPISNWTITPVNNNLSPASSFEPTNSTKSVDVSSDANQMPDPNTSAVFETTFELTKDQAANLNRLDIGQIDDQGTVFLNGMKIGSTNDWNRGFSFPVRSILQPGKNLITIWVHNSGGSGGLGRGVELSGPGAVPVFSRSLFNGLCQVIVKVGPIPGSMTITAKSAEGIIGSASVNLHQSHQMVSLP